MTCVSGYSMEFADSGNFSGLRIEARVRCTGITEPNGALRLVQSRSAGRDGRWHRPLVD